MILDERTEFCDDTALNTGAAGSYLIGDVVDLGPPITRDLGPGEDLYFVVQISTLPVSATGTVSFALCSDAQAAIAVDGSQTIHVQSAAFLAAALPVGTVPLVVALPQGRLYERFLGVVQTTAVAAFSAGKINAFLTHDYAKYRSYADAI